jgi:hypothetical protein
MHSQNFSIKNFHLGGVCRRAKYIFHHMAEVMIECGQHSVLLWVPDLFIL